MLPVLVMTRIQEIVFSLCCIHSASVANHHKY